MRLCEQTPDSNPAVRCFLSMCIMDICMQFLLKQPRRHECWLLDWFLIAANIGFALWISNGVLEFLMNMILVPFFFIAVFMLLAPPFCVLLNSIFINTPTPPAD